MNFFLSLFVKHSGKTEQLKQKIDGLMMNWMTPHIQF